MNNLLIPRDPLRACKANPDPYRDVWNILRLVTVVMVIYIVTYQFCLTLTSSPVLLPPIFFMIKAWGQSWSELFDYFMIEIRQTKF